MSSIYSRIVRKYIELFIEKKFEDLEDIKKELAIEYSKRVKDEFNRNGRFLMNYLDLISSLFEEGKGIWFGNRYNILCFEGFTGYRLLHGVSSGLGVLFFEVGLEFDPIFNLPVIRGSSIKGVLRSYLEGKIAETGSWEGFTDKDIKRLFGSKDNAGILFFMDAYPVKPGLRGYIVVPEIITSHYVREDREVFDEKSVKPNPILHVSVDIGVLFRFHVLIDKYRAVKHGYDLNLLRDKVKKLFEEGLENVGIGARTSSGYGVISNIKKCTGEE